MQLKTTNKVTVTYIIDHHNHSERIVDLVYHTTYVVRVTFIHKWRDLQFKVDSELQIIWKMLNGSFNYSQVFLPENSHHLCCVC